MSATDHDALEPPDELLLDAMREVDALTPSCPPSAPQPSPTYRRDEWLASLVPPSGGRAEVYPARPPLPVPDFNIFEKVVK